MEQAYATPQDVYTIDIGRETYRIPADYLVEADQRIDSKYVPKALEESRRDPQGSLFLMGELPDLTPLETGRQYRRPPATSEIRVQFTLTEHDNKVHPSPALLHSWARYNSNYDVPETWDKDGLIHLGYHHVGGPDGNRENDYAFVKEGKVTAQIRCGFEEDYPNPHCKVYQSYRDYLKIHVWFQISLLNWYAGGGIDQITDKLESWRVKENS